MHLYCPGCGHLIRVVGRWDGRDFTLSLRDGLVGKDSPPITICPECRRGLAPDGLAFLPPPFASPLCQSPASESVPDLDVTAR